VITGEGILKGRIAENQLAHELRLSPEAVHETQYGILQKLGQRIQEDGRW
jgi:hypothetical protein